MNPKKDDFSICWIDSGLSAEWVKEEEKEKDNQLNDKQKSLEERAKLFSLIKGITKGVKQWI